MYTLMHIIKMDIIKVEAPDMSHVQAEVKFSPPSPIALLY